MLDICNYYYLMIIVHFPFLYSIYLPHTLKLN